MIIEIRYDYDDAIDTESSSREELIGALLRLKRAYDRLLERSLITELGKRAKAEAEAELSRLIAQPQVERADPSADRLS